MAAILVQNAECSFYVATIAVPRKKLTILSGKMHQFEIRRVAGSKVFFFSGDNMIDFWC